MKRKKGLVSTSPNTLSTALARRILQRLEFHYTPKHGSWLNMAEIEIAILERNALS